MNLKINKIWFHFPFLALFIGTFMIVANFWHVITEWFANKPGQYFVGISHYYQDFFLYSSYIAQGISGSWLYVQDLYTNESLPAFWFYWFYALVGRIGTVTGYSAPHLYNLSLFATIVILVYVLYTLVKHIFPSSSAATVAFLFVLSASNFTTRIGQQMTLMGNTWFSPTPALNRLGGVPHQAMQTVLLILLAIIASIKPEGIRYSLLRLIFMAFISFISALLNPVTTSLLVAAFGCVWLTKVIQSYARNRARLFSFDVSTRIFLVISISFFIGSLLAKKSVDGIELYAIGRAWELRQQVSLSIVDWLISMGPIIFFVPFGILPYFSTYTALRYVLFINTALSVLLFFSPLPDMMGIARIRWLSPAAYLFFPILAAQGYVWLINKLQTLRIPNNLSAAVLLSGYILLSMPSLMVQIQERNNPFRSDQTIQLLNHLPKPVYDAYQVLDRIPNNETVIITDPSLPHDTAIPAFTAKTSFTGHLLHTLYPEVKQALREKFFSAAMTASEASQFCRDHRIAYILAKPENTQFLTVYTGMKKLYSNDFAEIYLCTPS
jgi:hypothetical protein